MSSFATIKVVGVSSGTLRARTDFATAEITSLACQQQRTIEHRKGEKKKLFFELALGQEP